jgi:small basic protein
MVCGSLLCIWIVPIGTLHNMDGTLGSILTSLFSKYGSYHSFKSFYFNILLQFTLYTGLTGDLKSLYCSEEVSLDLADVQNVQLP